MGQPNRTYTLDEASEELNISRETIERLLPALGVSQSGDAPTLTEDQVNKIVDLMNDPDASGDATK